MISKERVRIQITLTPSGFKTMAGLAHEFYASDFIFSGSFGLGILYEYFIVHGRRC